MTPDRRISSPKESEMLKIGLALCATIFAGGCASPTFVWTKQGAVAADHARDDAGCTNEAYLSAAATRVPAVTFYRNCMVARGWTLAEVR